MKNNVFEAYVMFEMEEDFECYQWMACWVFKLNVNVFLSKDEIKVCIIFCVQDIGVDSIKVIGEDID